MNIKKGVLFIVGMLTAFAGQLHAQTTDSLHTDTLHAIPVADTAKQVSNIGKTDSLKGLFEQGAVTELPDTNKHTIQQPTAQKEYIINGKVDDENTGEGIPFATIFFPGTSHGTSADLNGNFRMKMDKLPGDTLRIQAVGYNPYNRILNKSRYEYNFIAELQRANHNLNEVVIHAGEDPAILLIKNIIKHKPENNPDKTENYKYQSYNRLEVDVQRLTKSQFEKIPGLRNYAFIFNNLDTVSEAKPFLPLYMTETISDYYFQRHPKKQREFIKASMVKGFKNQSVTKFLGTTYQDVNPYKNFIPVFDKEFVSPISNSALMYYNYTIKDTEKAYGHNIILMQFEPRRPGENCFYGDFWVVDSVFALQRISMEVPKLANVNWVTRVSLYQEFAPVNDRLWFCIKDKFIADFDAPYGLKIPGVIGRKTTEYNHIVVNDTSISNVLDDKKYKEDVIISDSARERSEEWWANTRPDTLTNNEKAIYKMVDTINKMHITTVYKNLIQFAVTGVRDVGPLQLGPYFYIYSHNSVEGNRFRISLGTPQKMFKDAHFTGYLAYGDKDQRLKYNVTGLWLLNRKPRMYVYGTYTHDIDHSTNYYDQIGADNIFSALFRKPGIPWKLAFTDETRGEFYKEYFSGFSHKLSLIHREFTPYDPLPWAGVFVDKNGNNTQTVISSEVNLKLRFAYKEKFLEGQYLRVSLGSRYPIVELETGIGLKNVWSSAYDYQKVRLSISNTVKIPPLGSLYYNVFAGKYFGTLPYPLLEIHPGNEYLYYNAYAFEMMNKYEFISDEYAGFNIEHDIGGGIFNYIPALKRLHLRQFWTAKGVIGELSPENRALNLDKGYPFRTLKGDPYLELGTGVSNILQIFRIDFVWRVTPQPLPEEAKSKYFGIFGSVRFAF